MTLQVSQLKRRESMHLRKPLLPLLIHATTKNRGGSTKRNMQLIRSVKDNQPDRAGAPLLPPPLPLPGLAVAPRSRRADEAAGSFGDKPHELTHCRGKRRGRATHPHQTPTTTATEQQQHHHHHHHHDRPSNSVTSESSRAARLG